MNMFSDAFIWKPLSIIVITIVTLHFFVTLAKSHITFGLRTLINEIAESNFMLDGPPLCYAFFDNGKSAAE